MRLRNLLAGASLAALVSMGATGARASIADFIAATCGANCADSIGEESLARQNWSALSAMGTTQWIGASMGPVTVDASSLLAAARVAGATELDRWLNTGVASSDATAAAMSDALSRYTGIEITGITGTLGPNGQTTGYGTGTGGTSLFSGGTSTSGLDGTLNNFLQTALAGPNGFMGPGGGGGSGYCNQSISDAVNTNAQKFVDNMQRIATSGEFGFSQLGGAAISSGQRSQNGYFGSSCLDSMMQGTRDMLFKPPGLSSLLSQLGNMFGGGGSGGGGCGSAPSVLQQVANSLPRGIFQNTGSGGFFPYLGFGTEGDGAGNNMSFTSGFGLAQSVGSTIIRNNGGGNLAGLFNR